MVLKNHQVQKKNIIKFFYKFVLRLYWNHGNINESRNRGKRFHAVTPTRMAVSQIRDKFDDNVGW